MTQNFVWIFGVKWMSQEIGNFYVIEITCVRFKQKSNTISLWFPLKIYILEPRQRTQQAPRPHTPSYGQTSRSQNPYSSLSSHGSHGIHSQSPYDRLSIERSAATPHPGLSHGQPTHQPSHHQPTHHESAHHRSQSDALAQMRLAEERQREMYRLSR